MTPLSLLTLLDIVDTHQILVQQYCFLTLPYSSLIYYDLGLYLHAFFSCPTQVRLAGVVDRLLV